MVRMKFGHFYIRLYNQSLKKKIHFGFCNLHSQICMYAQIVHNKMFLPIFPLIEMYFLYTQKGGASNPHDTLLVDYSTIEYPLNKYWEAGRKKTHIPYRHT